MTSVLKEIEAPEPLNQTGEDVYYEYYKGAAYAMAQPSGYHQTIIRNFERQIERYLDGKPCQVYQSPFGVDLSAFIAGGQTLFLPDLSVVCDPAKFDARTGTYYAAPRLIIEVGSPSTIDRDFGIKLSSYEAAAVPEYLVVSDPCTVHQYVLTGGAYQKTLVEADKSRNLTVSLVSLPGLELAIKDDWFWFEGGFPRNEGLF